jgi:hypothetical protein
LFKTNDLTRVSKSVAEKTGRLFKTNDLTRVSKSVAEKTATQREALP